MNVFMVAHKETGDWLRSYKTRSNGKMWTDKQKMGTIWTNRNHAIQCINKNKLKKQVEVVEFELVELVRDPK